MIASMLIFSHLLENCFYLWPCQRKILRKSKVRGYYSLLGTDIPNNTCSFYWPVSQINYHMYTLVNRCQCTIFQFLVMLCFYKIILKVYVCLHSWRVKIDYYVFKILNWFVINFSILGVMVCQPNDVVMYFLY